MRNQVGKSPTQRNRRKGAALDQEINDAPDQGIRIGDILREAATTDEYTDEGNTLRRGTIAPDVMLPNSNETVHVHRLMIDRADRVIVTAGN